MEIETQITEKNPNLSDTHKKRKRRKKNHKNITPFKEEKNEPKNEMKEKDEDQNDMKEKNIVIPTKN